MARKLYVLRINPGEKDMVPEALEFDQLILGWAGMPELLDPSLTLDDFKAHLKRVHYPDAQTDHKAGQAAWKIRMFLHEMRIGDVVLVPHESQRFYIAQVAGDPFYVQDLFGAFRRAATWLNDKRPFLKSEEERVWSGLQEQAAINTYGMAHLPPVDTPASALIRDLLEEPDLLQDLAALEARSDIGPTVREVMQLARIGHGEYRRALLEKWDNACAVTACSLLEVVRASHVLRWCDSSDAERLDADNGLPLIANLDALFDRGLISFDDAGQMLVSQQLTCTHRDALGLPTPLRRQPSTALRAYLEQHRARYFKRD